MDAYTEQEKVAPWQRIKKADDEDVGIVIKYKGSEASCTITVSAAGDILSKIGDVGSEAADANFTLPSDGTEGTLDVSDATADTFGEIVDFINNLDDYEAYLVDVLRADSSNDTLLAMSASQAKSDAGRTLYKDTSVALNLSIAISAEDFQYGNNGVINELKYVYAKITNGSDDTTIKYYEDGTEVHSRAIANSGTAHEFDSTKAGHGVLGKKLLVRASGTACSGILEVIARSPKYHPMHKHKMA